MELFDPRKYRQFGETLREDLSRWAIGLSTESLEPVLHYLDHGEYEMAFEGFLLSAIEKDVPCSAQAAGEQYQLGIALNLHQESVFDPDLWAKALDYWHRFQQLAPTHPTSAS